MVEKIFRDSERKRGREECRLRTIRIMKDTKIDDLLVRRAVGSDAGAAAEVWLRSYAAALPDVRRAHTDDEVRAWFRSCSSPTGRPGWRRPGLGRRRDGPGRRGARPALRRPAWRGRGVGDRLVDLAKRRSPAGLELWTFQVNAPARRFYERHGFVAAEHTDGSRNEEREPDVRYAWRPEAT